MERAPHRVTEARGREVRFQMNRTPHRVTEARGREVRLQMERLQMKRTLQQLYILTMPDRTR